MFSWLTSWISGMGTPLKTLIGAILWVVAMGFIGKPAMGAMKDFSAKKYGEGLGNVGACILVIIIPVVATVLFIVVGKKTGDELNNARGGGFNILVSLLPAFFAVWQAKLHQKQLTADKL
ncbi:hypothetical protein [Lactiplantibacillus plantarum]|uniref:hypothetical protein n=1 Tax=Lactiplantibacillus plantarum TaxID=1590 RepID=UPI00200147B2|nr:hypothetical protein [Lactiplantibacillus plantarum]